MNAYKTIFSGFLFAALVISMSGCTGERTPISTVSQNCLTVEYRSDQISQGSIALFDGNRIYFFNSETGEMRLIYNNADILSSLHDFYVSPDHQKIVFTETYFDSSDRQAYFREILVFPDGQQNEVLVWPTVRGVPIGWLDNDRLIFSRNDLPFGTITLLNPLTGQSEEIAPTFSDLYSDSFYDPVNDLTTYILNPVSWFPILYDQRLSRAFLYLSDSNGMRYALWDAETRELLWEKQIFSPNVKPQWSPDGEQLIVTMRPDPLNPNLEEFFTISRNGAETQLTDLAAIYQAFSIGTYSWSPDGRFLAFWLRSGEDQTQPHLAVLSLEDNQISDYCVGPGGLIPIWSPDSTQIALAINRQPDSPGYDSVVIDVVNDTAVLIAEGEYPVGWMQSIP